MNLSPQQFAALSSLRRVRCVERMRDGTWMNGEAKIDARVINSLRKRGLVTLRSKNLHSVVWITKAADRYVQWKEGQNGPAI